MLRMVHTAHNMENGIDEFLLDELPAQTNCCLWNGVECEGGTVTGFVFANRKGRDEWQMFLDWLPNTVQFAYFASIVFLEPIRVETLPRDLRYLRIRSGQLAIQTPGRVFDAWKLPAQIEELRIGCIDAFCGAVYISALPKTMKMCFLACFSIKEVWIDNTGLPPSLEHLVIHAAHPKIKSIKKGKVDSRVRNGAKKPVYSFSDTSRKYMNICSAIEKGHKVQSQEAL